MFVNYSLGIGGIETLTLELCKKLDQEKFSASVCVFESGGELEKEFSRAGITVHVLNKSRGTDFAMPFRLAKLIKKEGVGIVHTQNQCAWLYGGIAAVLAGVPLVHTQHTTADYFNYHSGRWMKLEWVLAQFTIKISTVAASVAKFMIEKEGIARKKLVVIYNGVKPESYEKNVDVPGKKKELGLGTSEVVIGCVARLTDNKDHRTLLQAFKTVRHQIHQVKLLIVGDGPLKASLIEYTVELGLQDSVVFLGARRDIPDLLKVFDMFALSSIREGFPVVLLEAMISGLPVVCTDVDGNGELVLHEKTGLVVNARDPEHFAAALLRLIRNKDEVTRFGSEGRKRILESFTFAKMIKEYEHLYDEVIKQ